MVSDGSETQKHDEEFDSLLQTQRPAFQRDPSIAVDAEPSTRVLELILMSRCSIHLQPQRLFQFTDLARLLPLVCPALSNQHSLA